MGFSTNCTNKGCGKFNEPYLDPQDNKAYCSECNRELANLTSFAKNQMKSNKQFKKKASTSFAVKCKSCNKEDRPIILNDKVTCPSCKKEHSHLSEPFKLMLKEKLKTANQDIKLD